MIVVDINDMNRNTNDTIDDKSKTTSNFVGYDLIHAHDIDKPNPINKLNTGPP